MKLLTGILCAASVLAVLAAPIHAQTAPVKIKTGVEVFVANPPAIVKGKRIGLITNQSGQDHAGTATIDLIRALKDVQLVALFSPEHGIRGVAEARVASSTDEKTGLPIHSLYGETYKPTPEMLKDVDVLVYDIEDIGVRQYTYESTLTHALEAAAEKKIPIVVLDRPNPVSGRIMEGNILEPGFESFVGIHQVLSRHGMTLGELARMYNAEYKIGADLTVVPVQGWTRNMWRDQTDLPWVNPSPNIRTLNAAINYPGTVFFEAINVSEGRGTDAPFEQIGAPWLDNAKLVAEMNALKLPGIQFSALDIPVSGTGRKYAGEILKGVRFNITNRETYRPLETSLIMIEKIRHMHPNEFQWRGANQREPSMLTIERHGGTKKLKEAIDAGTLAALLVQWKQDQAKFARMRAPYLLYRSVIP
jgi:uncharacterized protein YbbC (DUF1343 family)